MINESQNEEFKSFEEVLEYSQMEASKYFEKYDTFITKTQELRSLLKERINKQMSNERELANYFYLNNINNKQNVKYIAHSIARQLIATVEISGLLKIPETHIHPFKDKFLIFGLINEESQNNIKLHINHFSFEILKYPLHFLDCNFVGLVIENSELQKHYANLSFERCEFLEHIIFYHCEIPINHTIEMKDCIIHKEFRMDNKIINASLYFNNSTFKDYVDFHESTFNQTACFYGVTFEKVPNFSQATFNGTLNLVNSNLNFGFKQCKTITSNEFEKRTKETNLKLNMNILALDKVANDFRDTFRIFKSALIKDNNLLDASNYHKIELYFKEIELNSKKPKLFSKEWIDLWQLKFYRLTSNHHTDLLKSFNSLLILIGIFALFGLGIVAGFNVYLGFCDSNPHAIIEFYNTHIKNAVINYKWIALGFNTLLSLAFVFLFCICQICGIVRKITLWICYPFTFAMLISSPKYLIPAIGIFTDKRILLDPLAINGSLYTIFFGFMIYSFIKTLRKNSIIPA